MDWSQFTLLHIDRNRVLLGTPDGDLLTLDSHMARIGPEDEPSYTTAYHIGDTAQGFRAVPKEASIRFAKVPPAASLLDPDMPNTGVETYERRLHKFVHKNPGTKTVTVIHLGFDPNTQEWFKYPYTEEQLVS